MFKALNYTLATKYADAATLDPKRGKSLEIHTHPPPHLFYGEGVKHYFQNSVRRSIGNLRFKCPRIEDLLVELCAHIYQHVYYYRHSVPRRWLAELDDTFKLLNRLNVDHIRRDIKSFRLVRAVKLSTELAGIKVPQVLGDLTPNPLHNLLVLIAEATDNQELKTIVGAASILLIL